MSYRSEQRTPATGAMTARYTVPWVPAGDLVADKQVLIDQDHTQRRTALGTSAGLDKLEGLAGKSAALAKERAELQSVRCKSLMAGSVAERNAHHADARERLVPARKQQRQQAEQLPSAVSTLNAKVCSARETEQAQLFTSNEFAAIAELKSGRARAGRDSERLVWEQALKGESLQRERKAQHVKCVKALGMADRFICVALSATPASGSGHAH